MDIMIIAIFSLQILHFPKQFTIQRQCCGKDTAQDWWLFSRLRIIWTIWSI